MMLCLSQVLKMTGKSKGQSQPVLRDTDPPRFHALNYVRSFTIGEYAPYEQGEHKMPRVFFATSCESTSLLSYLKY